MNDDAPRRPAVVPYITVWSAERTAPPLVTARRGGVAYPDEILQDRDQEGVLWRRAPLKQGQGRPEFGGVHPLRQRRAMRKLLCQVCAGPADRDELGVLWLFRDARGDWPGWPEDMAATHPPVCLPCAAKSIRACPYLRGAFVAVRVREPRVSGVHGARYVPSGPLPRAVEGVTRAYTDPDVRWVVAAQLVMGLHGCTLVPLGDALGLGGA
ncbi:hypothetical protein OG349_13495 [Streptomyces sp. NBC_01317]|uniref:hypothetical protein n=1 Tax=Streptomyces sp. NBC_01317 TaxID=2903822 RepID=UPI002E15E1E3|nr:hypothetical protein OG349_13495 [Streptomyces sp. NBC_01317]